MTCAVVRFRFVRFGVSTRCARPAHAPLNLKLDTWISIPSLFRQNKMFIFLSKKIPFTRSPVRALWKSRARHARMPPLTSITVHVSPLIQLSLPFLYARVLALSFPIRRASFVRCSVSLPERALMLLEASAALSPVASFKATAAPPGGNLLLRRPAFPSPLFRLPIRTRRRLSSLAAAESGQALTGLLFQPFEEIKEELSLLPTSPDLSLARQKYADECESALNQQIKSVLFFPLGLLNL